MIIRLPASFSASATPSGLHDDTLFLGLISTSRIFLDLVADVTSPFLVQLVSISSSTTMSYMDVNVLKLKFEFELNLWVLFIFSHLIIILVCSYVH